ncbi:MAG: enoyl-CoA hydratase [Deltaproteobacteria bacterium]|jgi:enoyl-CoA hydratase/carnithine racemase|nr:enoyl-CoA hydratase [Deltaproteobacteria bacterium]
MEVPPLSYETLETEREGAILRVWLNRPERRNAVSPLLLRELGDLFNSLETDFDTRLVVLGGRGKSFCAGADRKPDPAAREAEAATSDRGRRWIGQLGRRACRAIQDCEALTLAQVHGHAIGGGACLALSCDFRIAAEDAVFLVPEVDLAIPLSWGAVPLLIQEVGAARAREILLRCPSLDGKEAEGLNLVHKAVPADALAGEVQAWAEDLLTRPELAVHMTKTQLRGYARLSSLGDATEADGDLITVAQRSETFRERFAMPPKER